MPDGGVPTTTSSCRITPPASKTSSVVPGANASTSTAALDAPAGITGAFATAATPGRVLATTTGVEAAAGVASSGTSTRCTPGAAKKSWPEDATGCTDAPITATSVSSSPEAGSLAEITAPALPNGPVATSRGVARRGTHHSNSTSRAPAGIVTSAGSETTPGTAAASVTTVGCAGALEARTRSARDCPTGTPTSAGSIASPRSTATVTASTPTSAPSASRATAPIASDDVSAAAGTSKLAR